MSCISFSSISKPAGHPSKTAPITMLIWNSDQKSKDYDDLKTKLRPGHSDYPAMIKTG